MFQSDVVGKRTRVPVDFGRMADRGCNPLGMQALLDACHLNSSYMWLQSVNLFSSGVLAPRMSVSVAVIQERVNTMTHLYPVVNQGKRISVAVHEQASLRGFHIIGDCVDVAKFWAGLVSSDLSVRSFDIFSKAMCWTAMVPGMVYIPYLDFDELGEKASDISKVLELRVVPCITIVDRAVKAQQANAKYVVFYNTRRLEDGRSKFSFHVHWYNVGIESINSWKQFLASLTEAPRKLVWQRVDGAWKVEPDELKPMMDLAVYGGPMQLFRGPYCGKEGDTRTALLPVNIIDASGTPLIAESKDHFPYEFILMARIAAWPSRQLHMIGFNEQLSGAPLPMIKQSQSEQAPAGVRTTKMVPFLRPILMRQLLPAWQKFRRFQLMGLPTAKGAVVPVENLRLVKDEPCRYKPGVWFFKVLGDTFCSHDPDSTHSRNPRTVGITVDFNKCVIAQTCYACGGGVKFPKYNFLHTGNDIDIQPEADSKFTAISHWGVDRTPHRFILSYFADSFAMHRSTESLYVYDEESRTWKTGVEGNMVVGTLVDRLNSDYRAYIKMYKQLVVERQLHAVSIGNPDASQDEAEEKAAGIYEEARKFMAKNTACVVVSQATRTKFLAELQSYKVEVEVDRFNHVEHYIPMKNGMYVNVFTGETGEMKKEHYFTSMVDAQLTSNQDDIREISDFFAEISTGDKEKEQTLKRIAAYCWTMLIHDRKFYVLRGSGKNAKGAYKEFIILVATGPRNSPPRFKTHNASFWERRANQNGSTEQSTPEAFALQNKTIYYVDDMARVPLDADKLKKMVAGESASGRTHYGNPVNIAIRGKVVMSTNHILDLPGSDNAVWERLFATDFLAKYVEKLIDVNPAAHRYLLNPVKVQRLHTKLDAFFTVCVEELTAFYRTMPFGPDGLPTELHCFPVPASSEKTKEYMRSQQLPLASFMQQHTKRTDQPLGYVQIDILFHNYMTFLENMNEKTLKNGTTQANFIRLLSSGLDVVCTEKLVVGRSLTQSVVAARSMESGGGSRRDPDAIPPLRMDPVREDELLYASVGRFAGP